MRAIGCFEFREGGVGGQSQPGQRRRSVVTCTTASWSVGVSLDGSPTVELDP